MNKRGFTLIELIATIALLAVIAVIAFVSIGKVINNNNQKNCNSLADSITTATNEYVSDNRYNSSFINNYSVNDNKYIKKIQATLLVSNNYLNSDLVNPVTKEEINAADVNIYVYLKRDYTVSQVLIDSDDLKQCVPNYVSGNDSLPSYETYVEPEPVVGDNTGPTITYNYTDTCAQNSVKVNATDESGIKHTTIKVYKNNVEDTTKSKTDILLPYTIELDSEGTWKISTTATDYAGNNGTKTQDYTINYTVATPTITNPKENTWSNVSFKLTLKTTSECIDHWQYTFSSSATATGTDNTTQWVSYANSAKSEFTTTNFSAERNQLVYVRACNTHKCSTKAQTKIMIDKTKPVASYNLAAGTYEETTKSVKVTGSDAGGSGFKNMMVHVYKNGTFISDKSNGNITNTTYTVSLDSPGTWVVYTKVFDNAGNTQDQTPANADGWYYQEYELLPPLETPTITNPTNGDWTNSSFKLTYNISNSGISYWQYTYSASATATGTNENSNWVTYTNSAKSSYTTSAFSSALNKTIYVRACSSSTRCSPKASTSIKIDTTKPTASYNLTGGTYEETSKSVKITGSDTGGSGFKNMMVHVYKDGNFVNDKSSSNITSTTYTVNMDSAGTWNVYTKVFDNAGNQQNQTPANSDGWYYQEYILLPPLATPTIDNPTGGNWTNSNFKLTLNISNSGISYWQYTYSASATATGSNANSQWVTYSNSAKSSFTTTAFTAERNQLVYVRACTSSTRCSPKASTYIRIDKTAPKVDYSWPAGTYNNSLGYTRLTVSDSGSGVDWWHYHLYKNTTFVENQSRSFVTDTDTVVLVLDGYAIWTAFSMVYDKAGNRQSEANSDGWMYRQYTLTSSSGGGGGSGGGGSSGGSCSFTVNNGYSGSYTCTGHKEYSSGRCNCVAHCTDGSSTQNPC